MFKFFALPSPKELGLSEDNCMPIRGLGNPNNKPTWEDYYDILKKEYPIKYFLFKTIPFFFKKRIRQLQKIVNYIKHNTYKKYHLLDLRQPKSNKLIDQYRYGWCDCPEQMLYAMFNILNNFVEHELKHIYCPTLEEIEKNKLLDVENQDPTLEEQRKFYVEVLDIHRWWNIERKLEYKIVLELQDLWYKNAVNYGNNIEVHFKNYRDAEVAFEEKTDEMILRLMKIRRSLWS